MELLDGLCLKMKDYTLASRKASDVDPAAKKRRSWVLIRGDGVGDLSEVVRGSTQEEDARGKRLQLYCDSLVEEHEDDIYAAIQKGGFDTLGGCAHGAHGVFTASLRGAHPRHGCIIA